MRVAGRWLGIAAAVAAAGLAVSSCGEAGDAESRQPKAPEYTGLAQDRGPMREKRRVMGLYRDLQDAFFAGDAEAVCASFGRDVDSLSYYPALGAGERLAACERDVDRVARRVRDGEVEWPRQRVTWVRVYDVGKPRTFGGITMFRVGGDGYVRLQFVKRGGRWYSDWRVPDELFGLNGT